MVEALAKMIDYPNHSKWHAAYSKAREHVQDALRQEARSDGNTCFSESWHFSRWYIEYGNS